MSQNNTSLRDRISSFGSFVWNSEEKKLLGRGAKSWAEIGLFYLIYYICLAGFFIGMLAVFYQTIDEHQPKLTGMSSLLKANPGMGFKPMPDVEYTLVRFKAEVSDNAAIVKSIKDILEPYRIAQEKGTGVNCSFGNPAPKGEVCAVDYTALTAECNEANNFGYEGRNPKPCLLMRLNKIFDWMPEKYSEKNIKESGASAELRTRILEKPDMIYVECVGENPADRDNIGNNINYFPMQGFPHFYYPFTNQDNYKAPVIFVQFTSPPKNMALMIECRALAPNIKYDKQEKEGGVHFELLSDP